MIVRLYTITEDPRALDKSATPENGTQILGTVRDVADVLHPTITFAGTVTGYNYMYVPDFGRYYYLSPPTILRTGLTMYTGRVDVLHTYAKDIRELSGIPARSASAVDWYIRDGKQPLRAYRTIWTDSGTEMAYSANYVLITAG
jgi:hypothetical protein